MNGTHGTVFRDYGKPGCSLRTIATQLGRTCKAVSSKASQLGLSGHQQTEALERLAAGESYRAVARTLGVHHGTIARLAR